MRTSNGKLVTPSEATATVRAWRAHGDRVVLANGVFDLLHVGHVRYLEGARALGTRLVVGVNGDRSAHSLKGAGRPVVGARERATLVAALRVVDLVVIFEESCADELIHMLEPHVHAKGTDYSVDSVPERAAAAARGAETAIAGDPKAHATRELVERIRGGRVPGP